MASNNSGRVLAHQLSNGLYVSGRPEQYKDKQPMMSSTAVPYTGGDIKKSGELGKMFDIPAENPNKIMKSGALHKISSSSHGASRVSRSINPSGHSQPVTNTNEGSKSGPQSANISRQVSQSGPRSGDMAVGPNPKSAPSSGNVKTSGPQSFTPAVVRTNSGNLLQATGLITSGPLSSSGALKKVTSGPLDPPSGMPLKIASMNHNQAGSILSNAEDSSFRRGFPKALFWTLVALFVVGFSAGGFIVATAHNAIVLIVVAGLFSCVFLLMTWKICCGKKRP